MTKQDHLPKSEPSEEFAAMQKAETARRREVVRDVKPTVDRINKDQIKGGALPRKA